MKLFELLKVKNHGMTKYNIIPFDTSLQTGRGAISCLFEIWLLFFLYEKVGGTKEVAQMKTTIDLSRQ